MPIKLEQPEAYTGSNPYIFLSYSHDDEPAMQEVVSCLNQNGYNVWYDEGLILAEDWNRAIAQKIKTCTFFIALISANSLESRFCRDEMNYAWKNERPCLLVFLEDIELPEDLDIHFWNKRHFRYRNYKSVEDMLRLATREPSFERCRDTAAAEPKKREVPRPARPAKEEREVQTPYTPAPSEDKARQRLLEQLPARPDADQKAVLNDSDLMSGLPQNIKKALFITAVGQNPDKLGELLKTAAYTEFEPAIKLSLLEIIPKEELLEAALKDKRIKEALQSSGKQKSTDGSLSLEPIQHYLLEELKSKKEKSASKEEIIQFLKETEQKYDALDLSELRNEFWRTLQLDDIVYKEADFYKKLRPTSADEQEKYEAVSAACAVYCSIKQSETPETLDAAGARALYSLATTGRLSEDIPNCGKLSDSKRKELFQKLRNQTRILLKHNAQTLATSPELTLLALFGDKKKLGRTDLYRLAKWAHNNSVKLNRKEWVTCVRDRLHTESLQRYYDQRFESKRTIRILLSTAIILLVTTCATLTYHFGPLLYESYRTWKQHNQKESFIAWFSSETENWKEPLPEPLANALSRGNESGVFDFSGQKIDNALLERLVSGMKAAEELNLCDNQISELSPLATLPTLKTLRLGGNQITDLTALSSLKGLETLELNDNQIIELAPLSGLDALRTLNLRGNKLRDLSPLSELTGLETLELSGNPLRSLEPLASLSGLTELRLSDCASVTSLDALADLQKLKTLEAGGTDVSLRGLYEFAFSHSECTVYAEGKPLVRVYDTDGTPYLPGDPILNLSGQTAALPHFADNPELFDGLRVLDLSNAGLDDEQLAKVQKLGEGLGDRLRLLILIGNPKLSAEAVDSLRNSLPECEILASEEPASVENEADSLHWDGDFTELLAQAAEQPALYTLDLSQCKGEIDLAALAEAFPHLRALNLSGQKLSDLTGIDGLAELEWLNLSGNNLSALKELYEAESARKNLKWLNISVNPALENIQDLRNYKSLQVLYASELHSAQFPKLAKENGLILVVGVEED